jgi:hypothetical protein
MNSLDDILVTFTTLDGIETYTKCLKYLTLRRYKLKLGDFAHYIRFDDKEIVVSQDTYDGIIFACRGSILVWKMP